jgi:hypothetical protein
MKTSLKRASGIRSAPKAPQAAARTCQVLREKCVKTMGKWMGISLAHDGNVI